MKKFIVKRIFLCMCFCLMSCPLYISGQTVDNVSLETHNFLTARKIVKDKLHEAPLSLLKSIEQKLKSKENVRSVVEAPAYSEEAEIPRVMLGGYAVHLIGSSNCVTTTAGNVFGFDVNDLCRQTTYPSPFTSAGYDGSGKVLNVYCGDWVGDRWVVFTTIKEAGQTYLGYWMSFDPISRDIDIMGTATSEMQCQDMAFDVTTSQMYGVGLDQELYRFDIEDTKSVFVGLIRKDGEPFEGRFMALACDRDGVLYGINVDKNLYRIDKGTGAATLVGPLDFERSISPDNLQSATFDLHHNVLYFALRGTAYHELYTVDTTTGKADLVGNMFAETAGLFYHYYYDGDVPPEMVTDFKTVSDDKDPLKIKLSWRNPEKNFNWELLEDLSEIYIYRGVTGLSLTPIDTIPAAGAGAEMSFEVKESTPGTYYYGCMAVTKSGKRSLLAGGAAYCFESSLPYSMGFEKEDNYMPLFVPAGWRVDTLKAKYKHSGTGAIVTTSRAGNKIMFNALKAEKGATYQMDLWGLSPSSSGARFVIDIGNRINYSTSSIPRKTSPFTSFTVTGVAQSEILPVTIKCTTSGVYLDDISIKMLYPGSVPDSVKAPKVEIAGEGKLEAKVSWINPTKDAGGNVLKSLTGVVIQKTPTGGAFTTGVTADTIFTAIPGEAMTADIAIPKDNNYYFRLIPINEDGPCPYPYSLGKVGYIGKDSIPAAPKKITVTPVEGAKAKLTWEEVTSGKNGGFLGGEITAYEIRITTQDTKLSVHDTVRVSGVTEYVTESLPVGVYNFGVKAIRSGKDKGLEALVYATIGVREDQILVSSDDCTEKLTQNTHPLNILYGTLGGYSVVSQEIYTQEELGGKCVIDTLTFFLSPANTIDYKQKETIYIGYTEASAFESRSSWISVLDDKTQMVFSDTIELPAYNHIVKIPIKPFYYDGSKNLVITFVKTDDVSITSKQSYALVGENKTGIYRGLYKKNQNQTIDKFEDTVVMDDGDLVNFVPVTIFSTMANLATVKGTITDKETGEPIENLKIMFTPEEETTGGLNTYIINDSVTGKYDFAYLPEGNYIVSLSKLGYKEKTSKLEVEAGNTYTVDFNMEISSNITLKGKVVNPKQEPLEGVKVKAEGLLAYEAVTDKNGNFEMQRVLSDNSYRMSFAKEGYVSVDASWTLASKDTTVAAIALPYVAYPVSVVDVTATREVATIKIGKPALVKEATYATDTIAHKVGGNRERMIAAIEFYPSDIERFGLAEKDLVMVKFYANDPTASYVVHVYENECATLVYSQDAGNGLSGWQNVILNRKYAVSSEKEFSIGVEALPGYSGAPFALDLGPRTFKGDKVYFDGAWTNMTKLIGTYDYNWQIKGFFGKELNEDAAGGYQIYRFTAKDAEHPEKWFKVTDNSVSIPAEGYEDHTWKYARTGAYRYAVKADWMNNNLSEATASNNVYKGMDSKVKVQVNTNGASKEGAVVTLVNTDGLASHTYREVARENGLVEFPAVWNGNYMLTIVLKGHPSVYKDVKIQEDVTIEGEIMKEYISDPQILSAVVDADSVRLTWTMKYPNNWSDDFESYEDFMIGNFGEYLLDGKQLKYTMNGSSWKNNMEEQSFILFNPYTTIPPVQSYLYTPHSGNKELVAFAARSGENNDFIIRAVAEGKGTFAFYARGVGYRGNPEKFNVLYSVSGAEPDNFQMLSDSTLWATTDWQRFSFEVPEDAKYIAVQCVSKDLQAFLVDDMEYIVVHEGVPTLYQLYVDNAMLNGLIDGEITSFLIKNLDKGRHTVGIKAVFASGVSDLVTTEVVITGGENVKETEQTDVKLYPNPSAEGIFYISAPEDYSITVVTTDGKAVYSGRTIDRKAKIDLSAQPRGYYMIYLTNENRNITLKAIK